MSLIIEDKSLLDSLADAIIKANSSETKASATKSELLEIINNIIPQKVKFASGVFIPAEDIAEYNGPIIPYEMGSDDDGNQILPDLVLVYQPHILCSSEHVDAAAFLVYGVSMAYHAQFPITKLIYRTTQTPNSSGRYGTGSITGVQIVKSNEPSGYIYENGFRISGHESSKFLAQHPIVWMQLKF